MSSDRGLDKEDLVHMYSGMLLNHWKQWNNSICSNMDRPRECHTNWSKSDREGEISYDIPYRWNLKSNDTKELIYKKKETHRKQTYSCQREKILRDFGKVIYIWQYLKWTTNKDLRYSTRNSAQCYTAAWMGGGSGEEWIHVCEWLNLLAVHLKLPQHC